MNTPTLNKRARVLHPLLAGAAMLLLAAPAAARIVQTRSANTEDEPGLLLGFGLEIESGEHAVPLLLEWAATDRLRLGVESGYASVKNDDGAWVRGYKELETTAVYALVDDRAGRPGVALELDIKWPTGGNDELATGETDYTLGVILGKEIESGDLELSVSYTLVGDPPDEQLDNVLEVSAAGEWELNDSMDFIAELAFANGGGSRQTGFGSGLRTSSGSGNTVQATIGLSEQLSRHWKIEEGVTVDSDRQWQGVVFFEWESGGED